MVTKKLRLKSLLSIILAGTFLAAAAPDISQIRASAADVCVVNDSISYQNIRGFGGINHPEWTGLDMTESQRQTAFGNGDDELGLTILRVFVNPDSTQWYRALPTAQYATNTGEVTIFASPWEPPASLAESGGSNGKLHLPSSNYAAYAQHLNDFGTYMKNNGVDLYAISVQNEPDYASEWTYWSTDETTDFIANYGDRITSTRLMSPESFQYAPETASWVADGGKKFYKKILNNEKAFENCDLFGTHFYGTQRDWMDYPELENCGKEIWMTEVYVPNSEQDSANRFPEALQVSENIHNAMVVGNMSAYTWWYIRRHYGLMTEDGKISKRGYCMAQYSKYVRPGAVRISATEQPAEDVYISAYKNTDGTIAVVAINMSETGYAQEFSTGESIKNINRYRTSEYENIALTENLANENGSFFAQLPANSVSTFVIEINENENPEPPTEPVTEPDQPDENGYYFNDTFEDGISDWEGHGSSDVLLSGRLPYQGSDALLIQNRESSWNGAQRAIGSGFKAGEEYSFSVCAVYLDGNISQNFALTLQYTDSNGDIAFSRIASAKALRGKYVQLANSSFKLPEGGSDFVIYIETESGTGNFYIDEAVGAVAGTQIAGPAPIDIVLGDVNLDGKINVFDVIAAKRYYENGFSDIVKEASADADQSGAVDVTDISLIQNYLTTKTTEFSGITN